jgi:hypothetical protein
VLDVFGIADAPAPDLSRWADIEPARRTRTGAVTIAWSASTRG